MVALAKAKAWKFFISTWLSSISSRGVDEHLKASLLSWTLTSLEFPAFPKVAERLNCSSREKPTRYSSVHSRNTRCGNTVVVKLKAVLKLLEGKIEFP